MLVVTAGVTVDELATWLSSLTQGSDGTWAFAPGTAAGGLSPIGTVTPTDQVTRTLSWDAVGTAADGTCVRSGASLSTTNGGAYELWARVADSVRWSQDLPTVVPVAVPGTTRTVLGFAASSFGDLLAADGDVVLDISRWSPSNGVESAGEVASSALAAMLTRPTDAEWSALMTQAANSDRRDNPNPGCIDEKELAAGGAPSRRRRRRPPSRPPPSRRPRVDDSMTLLDGAAVATNGDRLPVEPEPTSPDVIGRSAPATSRSQSSPAAVVVAVGVAVLPVVVDPAGWHVDLARGGWCSSLQPSSESPRCGDRSVAPAGHRWWPALVGVSAVSAAASSAPVRRVLRGGRPPRRRRLLARVQRRRRSEPAWCAAGRTCGWCCGMSAGAILVTGFVAAQRMGWRFAGSAVSGRPGGPLGNADFLGAFAVLATLVALGASLDRAERPAWRLWHVVATMGAGWCLVVSGTRGAWVGLVAGLVVMAPAGATIAARDRGRAAGCGGHSPSCRWWMTALVGVGLLAGAADRGGGRSLAARRPAGRHVATDGGRDRRATGARMGAGGVRRRVRPSGRRLLGAGVRATPHAGPRTTGSPTWPAARARRARRTSASCSRRAAPFAGRCGGRQHPRSRFVGALPRSSRTWCSSSSSSSSRRRRHSVAARRRAPPRWSGARVLRCRDGGAAPPVAAVVALTIVAAVAPTATADREARRSVDARAAGRTSAALVAASRVVDRQPQTMYGLVLADAALADGSPRTLDEVRSRIGELRDRTPDDGRLTLARSRLARADGRTVLLADSVREVTALLRVDRARSEGWAELGELRLALGDAALAQAAFDRAVELRPDRTDAWLGVARAAEQAGDLDAARDAATHLDPASLSPGDVAAWQRWRSGRQALTSGR
ncbi:MAG: hypothetical protein U0Q22_13760 [Acidimicrobiales bacterium]